MKEKFFQWNNVLYTGIALCVIAALIFFCGFFTANVASLQGYHRLVLNAFAWVGVIGSLLCYLWALPYVIGWIAKTVRYYVRRWRYGYGY